MKIRVSRTFTLDADAIELLAYVAEQQGYGFEKPNKRTLITRLLEDRCAIAADTSDIQCKNCGSEPVEPVVFGRYKDIYCTECTCHDCGDPLEPGDETVCEDCLAKSSREEL